MLEELSDRHITSSWRRVSGGISTLVNWECVYRHNLVMAVVKLTTIGIFEPVSSGEVKNELVAESTAMCGSTAEPDESKLILLNFEL